MPDNRPTDVLIIGAGPAGLFAAFYAGLRGLSVRIVDSLGILGGQLSTLYPEKPIYDVAGFPSIQAKELAGQLARQAMRFEPAVSLGQTVQTLEEDGQGGFLVGTLSDTFAAKSVIIAAGIGAFTPRKLPLPDIARFEGRGLRYLIGDLSDLHGKRVLIVGGGDSAVDWANLLSGTASVTLIHRRDAFRAHEDAVRQLRASAAVVLTPYELTSVEGDDRVQAATVSDNRSGVARRLEVDEILANLGFESTLGPIAEWGLVLEKNAIVVDSSMQTSRRGVYACGDVCTYSGKLKLIATGFGEAASAANQAAHYVDPSKRVYPGHSSELSL